MKHSTLFARLLLAAVGLSMCLASCFPEPSGLGAAGAGGSLPTETGGAPVAAGEGGAGGEPAPVCAPRPAQEGAGCHPAETSEPLLGRAVDGTAQDRTVFASQLYTSMKSYCGGCHLSPASQGGFSFTSGTFATIIDQKVIAAITSNVESCALDNAGNKQDPSCFSFMPPKAAQGKPWSDREKDSSDPMKPLVRLLSQWIEQGRADTFTDAATAGGTAPFAVSEDLASAMTNLGTCVPDEGMVATEPAGCDADARFEAMAKKPDGTPAERLGLPLTLDQTDLNTFDSEQLARNGVVAYVPAYPLWTDDAGKLRMVRVPFGKSITFNKKTKQFDIPANTRFYKTFMKKVRGVDGVVRYHKIETRVIVSRPRDAEGKDQSLFGTYEWNDEETQADLLTDPQNNGEPFVDKVKPIIIDEAIAAQVKALVAKGKVRNFSYEMDTRHATRRYAFPSHERCIQCHMGSPSESFILGFTPLQLNTRSCSPDTIASDGHCDAGQYEPSLGDELTQVQRLTAYGVVSGYGDAELVKLEDPQGTKKQLRTARTPEELAAQGYMLGNCSHCHNPNGYPSVEHPELKPLLNFLPSDVGGIFGFPLERYSPRIFRNVTSDGPIPYITPSLRDRYGDTAHDWKPKAVSVTVDGMKDYAFIDAPWRSLIYRNVDTPFTYTDDSAIYPHMPLNSPGFDCRAPRILGEWMVSIPSLPKHPDLTEDVPVGAQKGDLIFAELDPQPYREVKPGDADYDNALAQTGKRLAAYRAGLRDRNYCPDTSDIVDLTVERSNNQILIPSDGEVAGMPIDNVPDKPHWVSVDLTNPPGDWAPRRPDWRTVLVDQDFSADEAAAVTAQDKDALTGQKAVVKLLQTVSLTDDFVRFAKTPIPFGVWQSKADCNFVSQKKLSQYDGIVLPRQRWMDLQTSLPADSPIYSAIPGSLVFNMICVNCHGADADSSGRQAQTLAEMTGGTARVANFRDGFFGPFGKGGENRNRVFGSEDLSARYLPWMALGGTKARIPRPILNLVANTPVLGETRRGVEVSSANMLQTGQALCKLIGEMKAGGFEPLDLATPLAQAGLHGSDGQLISKNGDSELWARLCTYNNPAPIHVISVNPISSSEYNLQASNYDTFFAQKYPPNTPVGDQTGRVQSALGASNDTPWCVRQPLATDAPATAWLAKKQAKAADGQLVALPICPSAVLDEANRFKSPKDPNTQVALRSDMDDWAARGAINAGQAVFVYLRQMISEGKGRDPRYDECEQLGK
ncbi:MAG TPA: hypothetical protein VER96_31035 [Polyangiaceae bacterium]|nr:hypothetical protein [Polyangiaceae bacterium]